MKRAVYIIALLFISFYACTNPLNESRKLYKSYFNMTLKDPSSLVIYKEEYVEWEKNKFEWTLDIGAKNEYGGMVRKTYHIKTDGGRRYIEVMGPGEVNYELVYIEPGY